MKRVFAAVVVSIAVMSSVASAADIGGYDRAPVRVTAYNWQGLYLGGNLGYQWGKVTNSPVNPSGFMGGLGGGARAHALKARGEVLARSRSLIAEREKTLKIWQRIWL